MVDLCQKSLDGLTPLEYVETRAGLQLSLVSPAEEGRLHLGPMMNFAPCGTNEREPPDLLRFRVTPGAILIRLQKRKAISSFLQSAILL